MNQYLKNLNRIEFVVTMACTGRCKHCSEGEHISDGEHIDGDAAAEAVCEICENYNIDSLMTFGGEPLLYPQTVCKIMKETDYTLFTFQERFLNRLGRKRMFF